ncbi:hypothetical protein BLA29_004032 [Euroglyphus maynei]|uniref:BZIP domain-containing protein n=1 Tax=Euroglyphus maynei TaxID=6958 RepID=A0A1Y3B6Q0_EURMA|nr:hypothetical protein BLA29_004032 [Euroglyphus maynei]
MKPIIGLACWPGQHQATLPADAKTLFTSSPFEQGNDVFSHCFPNDNFDGHRIDDDVSLDADLINCSDSQLEEVIFEQCHNHNNDDLCQGFGHLSFDGIERLLKQEDFDFLNIKPSQDLCSPDIGPYSPSQLSSTFDDECYVDGKQSPIIQSSTISSLEEQQCYSPSYQLPQSLDVANYEEVCTSSPRNDHIQPSIEIEIEFDPERKHLDFLSQCCQQQQSPPAIDDDDHSLASYLTMTTAASSPNKRKSVDSELEPPPPTPVKERKRRRAKRVLDDRIKYQNKVAAMRYRKKKQEEKSQIDDLFAVQQERHERLSNQVEELTVQINVLKELLSKYLSPKLLNSRMA